MRKQTKEHVIVTILQAGFERAASAFGRIIEKPVGVERVESVHQPEGLASAFVIEPSAEFIVLTTQLIGEIPGKSYLVFNIDESEAIRFMMQQQSSALHEAALKEIDNILSAAIISDLSNALDAEVYGDVPHLVKMNAQQVKQFFENEMLPGDPGHAFFTTCRFLINNSQKIHPRFIWKLSPKIFDMIAV